MCQDERALIVIIAVYYAGPKEGKMQPEQKAVYCEIDAGLTDPERSMGENHWITDP